MKSKTLLITRVMLVTVMITTVLSACGEASSVLSGKYVNSINSSFYLDFTGNDNVTFVLRELQGSGIHRIDYTIGRAVLLILIEKGGRGLLIFDYDGNNDIILPREAMQGEFFAKAGS